MSLSDGYDVERGVTDHREKVVSVLCAFSGIIISILAGTPVGSTIVAVDVSAFAVCYAAGRITGGVGE